MTHYQKLRVAMQELIDANQAHIEAYGDRPRLAKAIARVEVASRTAEKILEEPNGKLAAITRI